MNLITLIARRYLFSRQHISLVSTLTLISISGVTIGTALLIIVLSVFNGFFSLIKDLLLTYDPDIRIERAEGGFMDMAQFAAFALENHPEIVSIEPYLEGKALLAYKGNTEKVVVVKGVSDSYFKAGSFESTASSLVQADLGVLNGRPGILFSDKLLHQLRLDKGDGVSLLSAKGIQRSFTQLGGPRLFQFEVRDSYELPQVVDASIVFISLEAAQRLFFIRNQASGYDIKLKAHEKAEDVAAELRSLIGDDFRVSTWYDLQKPLYDVMYLEKWGAYVILMIIVLVAVLNIVGSLSMIVIQKKRDIGILQALGMDQYQIKAIFQRQGALIGLIGCGIGGGLGLLLSWLQDHYGFVKLLGAESFIISSYPISIQAMDVSLILVGSFLLCMVASYLPAKAAMRIEPSEAIRYE